MRAEISKLHQRLQTTFIYVTHDQVEAMTMGDRIVVLKDGVIQQVGTPQEVYAHPANVFVAGFIGTPSMNFMTGMLTLHDGTLAFDTGTFRVLLPRASAGATDGYADRAVIAGVRPSAIQVLPSGGTNGVEPPEASVVAAKVDVVEPMGDVAYIFTDVGGQTFTVRVDPTALPNVGQVVLLCLDGAALHLFDAETQQAIASPTRELTAAIGRQ
jgi:multiple sugar transport system ATP-binding protein